MILRAYNCEFSEIDLSENVAVLELEPPQVFNNVLADLTDPVFPAREIMIEDEGEPVAANSVVCLCDFLNFSLNGKTLLGKLYKHIDNTIFSDPEERAKLDNLISQLRRYFLGAIACLDVDVDAAENIGAREVCTMLGIEPLCVEEGVAAKIEQFITLGAELKLFKVIALIQAKAYVCDADLERIYRRALSHRIGLIMVESAHRHEKLYAEKKIFVDREYADQAL